MTALKLLVADDFYIFASLIGISLELFYNNAFMEQLYVQKKNQNTFKTHFKCKTSNSKYFFWENY